MSRIFLLVAVLLFAAGTVEARAVAFPPVPWSETHVERTDRSAVVKDAAGRPILTVITEGKSSFITNVDLRVTSEGLVIDASKAFRAGSGKVVMNAPTLAAGDRFGGRADIESVWRRISSGEPCPKVQMYMTGSRTDGAWFAVHGTIARITSLARSQQILANDRELPEKPRALSFRFDVMSGGRVLLAGGRVAPLGEIPRAERPRRAASGPAKLLMNVPFDGLPDAAFASGSPRPLVAKGLSFVPGVKGRAVRLDPANASALEYAFGDNARRLAGSVSLWFRADGPNDGAFLFSTGRALDEARHGTLALFLWFYADHFRYDIGDDDDRYLMARLPSAGVWHHAVFTWDAARGGALYVDGKRDASAGDRYSPIAAMFHPFAFSNVEPVGDRDRLVIGACRGRRGFKGDIDELKVYSAPLDAEAVKRLYLAERTEASRLPDYPALAAKRAHAYVAPSLAKAGQPGARELVREIRFDSLKPAEKFVSVGDCRVGSLDGTPYLEAGGRENDRFAVALDLDPKEPFYWLEIDYPDDRVRTMDLLVADAKDPHSDYALGVGVMCGGEYPNANRIRTHRCILWPRAAETSVAFMTARAGSPAAVSRLRVYRDCSRALPAAKVNEPPRANGWGRTVGIYFEDCAVNYDFGVSAVTPAGQVEIAARLAAHMRFTGENLFAHPGVFYHGLIDDSYQPRTFAPDYLSAFYSVFDREGLGLMPTVNCDSWPDTAALISRESVADGSVHASVFSVPADGLFRERRSLSAGSIYNIADRRIQDRIERDIDALLAQGLAHPSFKGIALHFKYGSVCWFGTLQCGYNDANIAAFERATGLHVPGDRSDPLRAKAYSSWLLANARDAWINWRCGVVTDFWIRMAKKLAAARGDLKLWVNFITNLDPITADGVFLRDDYLATTARQGGFDAARFSAAAPNGMVGVTHVPADYRWLHAGERGFTQEMRDHIRASYQKPSFYSCTRGSAYPMAHTHDRYWEDACGAARGKPTLTCPWMNESRWRVGTINPVGRYALEQFVVPLRHGDKLGLTKGGWMIDTYGLEDVLAPFAQAFRALPAKVMRDVPGASRGLVRVRACAFGGRRYLYAVNTGDTPADVTLDFPCGATDLVRGESLPAGRHTLRLDVYELRSFNMNVRNGF